MFLKTILPLLFMILPATGAEITVISGNANFNLALGKKGDISLKGHLMNLNMKKTKCNSHIVSGFARRIKSMIKTKSGNKKRKKNRFKIILNGTTHYERYSSRRGKAFLKIPEEVQRIKIEEKILCGSSSK